MLHNCTECPRSLDQSYTVTYYEKGSKLLGHTVSGQFLIWSISEHTFSSRIIKNVWLMWQKTRQNNSCKTLRNVQRVCAYIYINVWAINLHFPIFRNPFSPTSKSNNCILEHFVARPLVKFFVIYAFYIIHYVLWMI